VNVRGFGALQGVGGSPFGAETEPGATLMDGTLWPISVPVQWFDVPQPARLSTDGA